MSALLQHFPITNYEGNKNEYTFFDCASQYIYLSN